MNEWNGFGNLDLTGVDPDAGSSRLQPGTYQVKCTEAKIESIGNTHNKKLVVTLEDTKQTGDIRTNFNIVHSSKQAQDIGMRQLKSFLIAGKHPNPDRPSDVATLKGLQVKIIVGMGKPWVNNEGRTVSTSEVKKYMDFNGESISASNIGASNNSTPSQVNSNSTDLDDEIPF